MSYHTIDTDSDNVYLNVVFNPNPANLETPTIAQYNVTKTNPIINKCSDYYCTVIRFEIPLNEIPIFIFPVIPNSGTSNTSPMIMGISVGGTDYPVNLIYVPDNALPQVNQNDISRQIITPFYYVYNYQNLINSMNTALNTAYTNAGSPGAAGAPYLFLDTVSELISFVVPSAFIAANATIFYNESVINHLDSLPVYFYGWNRPNGKDYVLRMPTTANFEYNPKGGVIPSPATFYKYTSEYNTLIYWDSFRKLLITTNEIPINNESVPAINNSGLSVNQPIITDFTPALQDSGDSRSIAYYNPTAQYRLIDLISDKALSAIDLRIFWEDKIGNTYPLYISAYQQGSIKLGFLKKTLYKNDNLLKY